MSDFVFREEGSQLKFVGDFDGLYRDEVDPWGQSARSGPMAEYYDYSRGALINAVKKFAPPSSSLLEVGCGLGYVLSQFKALGGVNPTGMDVSGVAVERARKLFSELNFIQADITSSDLDLPERYDCLVLNQVLWYILHRMDVAVLNCRQLLWPDGILIISQAFLRGEQRYGKEVVDGLHGLLERFSNRYQHVFSLLQSSYDGASERVHHDGLLVFRADGFAHDPSH